MMLAPGATIGILGGGQLGRMIRTGKCVAGKNDLAVGLEQ